MRFAVDRNHAKRLLMLTGASALVATWLPSCADDPYVVAPTIVVDACQAPVARPVSECLVDFGSIDRAVERARARELHVLNVSSLAFTFSAVLDADDAAAALIVLADGDADGATLEPGLSAAFLFRAVPQNPGTQHAAFTIATDADNAPDGGIVVDLVAEVAPPRASASATSATPGNQHEG